MASNAAKALRSALALNKLDGLSQLLADKMGIQVPEIRPYNRDPQLRQIMRVEAINKLLESVLTVSGVEIPKEPEPETADEVVEETPTKAKKAAKRKATKK